MRKLKNGDVVISEKRFYDHYGIYEETEDGGRVIHYTKEKGNKLKGVIQKTSVNEFLGNGKLRVKEIAHGNSAEEAVKMAESKIGDDKYNLVTNNCEHFAMECKTGEARSSQVFLAGLALAAGILLGAGGAFAMGKTKK